MVTDNKWNGNGMEMEWKWNGNGMEMEWKWKWNGNGMEMEMEWKWNGNGMEMEWKWNGNGMEMEGFQVRSIQWRQAEVLQYNPNFPAAHPSLIPAKQPLTPMSFNTAINPPFFPPAPTPQPLIAPSPNPFYNQHGSQRAINSQLTIGQTQPKTPHTNAFNPINPFIQINPNFHYHKSANRNNSRNTKRGRKTQKNQKPYQGAYFTG